MQEPSSSTALVGPDAAALPLRKSIRRLRWFIRAFLDQVARVEADTGNRFTCDERGLSAVFVEWLRAFEAQKPTTAEDRLPYVGFAAGLMLRTLIAQKPLTLQSRPAAADDTNPAYFWPEGYVYVAFCLNIRALVLAQDFDETQELVPALSELRSWWSFRENVDRDDNLAIAFLDLFAGEEPDWETPELFRGRQTRRIAEQFYRALPEHAQEGQG
ncbi:MAG: hypothetical protein AAGC92_06385 [Pseudomonadota bacterium]